MGRLFLLLPLLFVGQVTSLQLRRAWGGAAKLQMRLSEPRISRKSLLSTTIQGSALIFAASRPFLASATTTESGLEYTVLQKGSGAEAEAGDIVCVRFVGKYKDYVIDNIMDNPEPYFYRIGSGTLLPGIDEALKMMKVGDRWQVTLPGQLAFGPNGKRARPGVPAIPPMATLNYELYLESIPGKDDEVIMLDDVE